MVGFLFVSILAVIRRFLEHCRIAKRLSGNTLRAYDSDFADFATFVGRDTGVDTIDRETLRRYARHLFDVRALKETSVKRKMAALKVMFRWLERDEVIALSPFHRLDLSIRLPRRLPRALGVAEMRRLLRTAEDEARDGSHGAQLLYFVVVCLFATGLRVGELVTVRLGDVDVAEGSILVRGKGNRERRVYLPGREAGAILRHQLDARIRLTMATDRLLVTEDGEEVIAQYLRRRLVALAERAGIERRVTPHMLRHTAATQLIEAGVDIRFVQKLLGHASIATTQIYTQVSDASLKATLERANTLRRMGGGEADN